MPCILGFNVLSGLVNFGAATSVLDLEDFIVSNVLLPLGSLIFVLFCTLKKGGWGWNNFKEEANTGKGLKVKDWMRGYLTYILPIVIFVFFAIGIYNFFK
jgi:NSS family neurotransmitter:Na+ symporter